MLKRAQSLRRKFDEKGMCVVLNAGGMRDNGKRGGTERLGLKWSGNAVAIAQDRKQ